MEAVLADGHVRALAIADPLEAHRAAAMALAPDARAVNDFAQLLEMDLAGIVIATPNACHATQAVQALERGFNVFCQKPLGLTPAEVERVVAAARQNNLLLHVDWSYRHAAAFTALRSVCAELGPIYAARLVFHNAYGPDKAWFYDVAQSGGGCLMDLGTHLIDMALWLLPDNPVVDVRCRTFRQGKPLSGRGVEDYCTAQLRLRSGAVVDIACSWNLPVGRDAAIEAEVFGENGGAGVRNVDGSFYDFVAHRYQGTKTTILCTPPDRWGGRAICQWARQLGAGFDRSSEALISVARVVDALYHEGG